MTKVSKMPDGWKKSKLGLHINLLTGYPFKSSEYIDRESSIRLLRGDNVIQGTIRWGDAKRWDIRNAAKLKRYQLHEGDFVIAMDRTWVKAGLKAAQITASDTPSLLVQRVARLRSDESLCRKFLPDLVRSYRFEQYVKEVQTETAVPHISPSQIKNFPILLPPLPEQKAIADLLSTWDSAIEKTERLIKVKENANKGLMQMLLFGKVRIGGRRITGVQKKRWFSVPSDWNIVKIGSVSKEVSTKNHPGDDIPVLSCTKYDGLVDSLKYFDKQIYSKDTSTYRVVAHGQFAYATNHIEEGSIGYQNLYPQGLVSPMYTVFKTDKQKVNDGYLYTLLKTETYKRIFEINTNASVDRRGSLRWKEFSKLPIPFPSLDEQAEINEVLDTAQREVDLLRGQLELLKKQKRGLMQKLLTGQWRVQVGEDES